MLRAFEPHRQLVRDGELLLGTWQQVLYIELDRERDRRWLVQVVGS
jgi:thiamine phosphate synthase YjbQ (UPF0047 family)